jgi:peptidoglycan lytic transglycosylase
MLCVPALAWASSGGGGIAPESGASGHGASGGAAQPGNGIVTASGDGMTIATRASALLRNGLQVSGQVPSGDAGKLVVIERWGAKTNWTWEPTAQTTAASDGSFAAVWQTNHIGRFALRAVVQQSGAISAAANLPTVTVTVYRPSLATLYGPGFYGNRTACGTILRSRTIGVANRTLPCGTLVAIYYHGQTLIVPVIDRGPYANGADWDLTMATGKALGMDGTATVGAVSLPRTG